jgi:hypothetical protein
VSWEDYKPENDPYLNGIEYPEWQTAADNILPSLGDAHVMDFGHSQHGHAGVMTLSGVRDLMSNVKEEIHKWEERGERDHDIPEFLRKVLPVEPDPVYVKADILPSARFHVDTFIIPAIVGGIPQGQTGGATLLSARGDRTRIIVTNVGANPAYVSWTDDVSNVQTLGEMAWIQLPAAIIGSSTPSVAGFPSITVSGQAIQNPFNYPVSVTLAAFTATQVFVNGILVGTGNGPYIVPAYGSLSVTFTVAGTTTPAGIATVAAPAGLQPGNPREIRAGGKVYAYSPLGSQLDIQEEYGFVLREGGFQNP